MNWRLALAAAGAIPLLAALFWLLGHSGLRPLTGYLMGLAVYWALLALALLLVLLPPCALADTHETVRVGWFLQPGYQGLDSDGNPSGYNYEFLMKMAEKK